MKNPGVFALWNNVDEYLRSARDIRPGTLLFDINTNQAYGIYLGHNEKYVQLSNTNPDWLGVYHNIRRTELMVNLIWLPNRN